jgi:Uma2 family endonuclease
MSMTEYLTLERDTTIRHEWVAGELFAMAGGSGRHNQIAVALAATLLPAARQGRCRVYVADMKVLTAGAAYYPDVMVACGDQADDYYETSACTIVEVSSPSTGERDRREKRIAYQTLPSLRHYLIVDPTDLRVVHYLRTGDDEWGVQILGPDDRLALTCPEITLDIGALFEGI